MATIFAYPNPTGSGNCAVLSSQENYYAPFLPNIGTWTQLRVSAYLGYCGTSGSQSFTVPETLAITGPNLGWYWGIGNFSSSLGLLTPLSVGCNFVGVSSYGQGQTVFQFPQGAAANTNVTVVGTQTRMAALFTNGGNFSSTQNTAVDYLYFQQHLNTGNVNYMVPSTLAYTIFNKGLTGQQVGMILSYDATGAAGSQQCNSASFPDLNALRAASMNLLGTGLQSSVSFVSYYTTGLVQTGGPLPIPDTVYFHSPFNNNLLRVHELLVEKFV